MTCKLCEESVKNWTGDDPKCYFDDPDGNWNCATLNALRQILIDEPEGICHMLCDDEHCALVNIGDVWLNEECFGYYLVVQWYKYRGHTERLLVMCGGEPRRPTEEELLAIIKYYGG